MINDNNFDNYVRDKLLNHESRVPAGLWDKIAAEQPRKRRVVAFWISNLFMGSAAALATIVGGIYWLNTTDKTLTGSTQIITTNQPSNIIDKTNTPNKHTFSTITDNEKTNAVAVNKSISKSTNISNTNAIDNKQSENKAFTIANNSSKTKEINASVKKNLAAALQQKLLLTPDELTVISHPENTNSVTASATNTLAAEVAYKSYSKQPIESLNKNLLDRAINFDAIIASKKQTLFRLDCPNINHPTWYVELYGSPNITMQNIFSNGASSAYLQRKDSSEKLQLGFTVGARISKTFGEHFLVKTGLQFTQVNQLFTTRSENERKTTTIIVARTIIDGNGSTKTIQDTTSVTEIGYRIKTTQNRFKSLEIPIIGSYEYGNNNWHFALNGGVIINSNSWYSGETLDTAYQVVTIDNSKNAGIYQSMVSLSLYGGISIIKKINKTFEVFAEPYFRYGLNNSTYSNIGFNQKFNAVGISLGMRLKLNNSSGNNRL